LKRKEKKVVVIATGIPDRQRDKALQRALKFTKLFQEETFEDILKVLNTPTTIPGAARPVEFDTACNNAKIRDPADQAWLWNYLRNMNVPNPHAVKPDKNRFWDEASEAAAGTGW
jgi:hypothetical protein